MWGYYCLIFLRIITKDLSEELQKKYVTFWDRNIIGCVY